MRNDTRLVFNQYLQRQEQLNNIPSASQSFTVIPTVQQRLESLIQESSSFLASINMVGVDQQSGEKLGLGISGPIASRTNTITTDRAPRSVETLMSTTYTCQKTDSDTAIKYATLDMWAKFPDFQTRVRNQIVKRQALDRILIGMNGTSAAATTDRVTNPLLQDVNIGWLQHIRTNAPIRVLDDGATAGKISIGAAGDYKNLDSLVYDATKTLLDPWYQEDTGLVAIVGRDLMHDKLFPLVSNPTDPTQILAADIIRSQHRLGGLSAITVPYFPAGKVLITRLDNLSIYWQISSRRRHIKDNPKRDQIENYESGNDAFVIEDYGLTALVENIVIS